MNWVFTLSQYFRCEAPLCSETQQKRTDKALPGAEVIPFELGPGELLYSKEAPECRNCLRDAPYLGCRQN